MGHWSHENKLIVFLSIILFAGLYWFAKAHYTDDRLAYLEKQNHEVVPFDFKLDGTAP